MKNRTTIKIFTLIFTFLLVTSLAYASPGGEDYSGCREGRKGKETCMQKLDLTAEQERELMEQRCAHKEEIKGVKAALKEKRAALREELQKDKIDKKRIGAIKEEVKTLMGKQLDCRIDSVLAMKEILTPEQFNKLESFKAGKKGKRRFFGRIFGHKKQKEGFR